MTVCLLASGTGYIVCVASATNLTGSYNNLYADDICLLALSASAMQSLLDVCYEYGTDNDILFNLIKSVCTSLNQKLINHLFQQSLLAMMHLNLLRKLNI